MTYIIYLYQAIFYRPILNILVYFYQTIAGHDFGLAIIFATLLIRFVLYPLFHKGAKHQMALQRLQPKIKKIQEVHKNDKQKQSEALMELYKEHGVNPFLSIILLIVQLPILLSLYRIILSGLGAGGIGSGLYSFVAAPQTINALFLGVLDLKQHSIILVLLTAIAQYFQSRLAIYRAPNAGEPSPMEKMAKQMAFIGPVITVVIFYNLPAGVSLYWLVSSLFSIGQQLIVNKHLREKYGE